MRSVTGERIRLATFNLRGVWGPKQQAIARLLNEAAVDLVCLQECWASTVEPIRDAMGPEWTVTQDPRDETSNAVLSRLPFSDVVFEPLELGGAYAERSAVIATLTWPGRGPLRVCSTHLEQREEQGRLAQWELLSRRVKGPLIVAGDLNALRRADYSLEQWASIQQSRIAGNWEPPVSLLTSHLADVGYRDAWVQAGEGPLEETCRYGTRIDYLLLSPDFPGDFVPGSYRQFSTISDGLSDHALVTVDLDLLP